MSVIAMTKYGANLVSARGGDKVKGSLEAVSRALQGPVDVDQIEAFLRNRPDLIRRKGKYDNYVPEGLLEEAFIGDGMDLGAAGAPVS